MWLDRRAVAPSARTTGGFHREADLLQAMRFEEIEGAEFAQLAAGVITEDVGDEDAATAEDDATDPAS